MWHVGGRREMNARLWWGERRKQPFGRPRHRGVDNIKADLKENIMAGRGSDLSGSEQGCDGLL